MSQRAALTDYGRELTRAERVVAEREPLSVVQDFVAASEEISKRFDAAFNSSWLNRIVNGAGLTQARIAEALGVSKATITHFRQGTAGVSLRDNMEVLFGHFLDRDRPLRRAPRSELRDAALIVVVGRMSSALNRSVPVDLDRLGYEFLRRITAMESWWQGQKSNDVEKLDRAVKIAGEQAAEFFQVLKLQNYPGLSLPDGSLGKTLEEVENLFRWWQPLCLVVKDEIVCFNRGDDNG